MTVQEILARFKQLGSETNRKGMVRFGIEADNAFGLRLREIRKLAREIKTNHDLALQLWQTGKHEARILATMVADKNQTDKKLMLAWANEFDSWDICDQACGNLFCFTAQAYEMIPVLAKDTHEFVRRTAFSLLAYLAVHDKKAEDKKFVQFLPLIAKYSSDERNFVKKAVNWALRQIGKRNRALRSHVLKLAEELSTLTDKTKAWIGKDAVKELSSKSLETRLKTNG